MKKRSHHRRNRKLKKQRKIYIISIIILILTLSISYSAFQTRLQVNVTGKVKEKSRTIKIYSNYIINNEWASNTPDFHNDEYRDKIVNITFLNTVNIPNNSIRNWDISDDNKGGVIAYITLNNEDNTKYDLFIGAKNGIIANKNSSFLFLNFTNLKTINFNNNFDTSNTENMEGMFRNCTSIESLDLTSFNTSKVTNMYGMFCFYRNGTFINNNLKHIEFGNNFITSNVTNMGSMFAGSNLENINLSTFNTNNVTSMFHMFSVMKLTELDLSNFNTSNVTNTQEMFIKCYNLKTIYVSENFVTTNITNSTSMFVDDTNLVGGNGTTYDANHIDKEYARIDTAQTPGYFTLKE